MQIVRCPYVIIEAQQISVDRHLINGVSRRGTRREIAFIYTEQRGSGDQTLRTPLLINTDTVDKHAQTLC